MSKTSQFKTACKDDSGSVAASHKLAQLKQPKSKRWYYSSANWLYGDVFIVLLSNITFLIFAVLRCDTIRYNTLCLRALKSWRDCDCQLNLVHGTETKNKEKQKNKNRVAQEKRLVVRRTHYRPYKPF